MVVITYNIREEKIIYNYILFQTNLFVNFIAVNHLNFLATELLLPPKELNRLSLKKNWK